MNQSVQSGSVLGGSSLNNTDDVVPNKSLNLPDRWPLPSFLRVSKWLGKQYLCHVKEAP